MHVDGARYVAVDGEVVGFAVGSELTHVGSETTFWPSGIYCDKIIVEVEEPFMIDGKGVIDGASFTIEKLTSLVSEGRITLVASWATSWRRRRLTSLLCGSVETLRARLISVLNTVRIFSRRRTIQHRTARRYAADETAGAFRIRSPADWRSNLTGEKHQRRICSIHGPVMATLLLTVLLK